MRSTYMTVSFYTKYFKKKFYKYTLPQNDMFKCALYNTVTTSLSNISIYQVMTFCFLYKYI